MPLFMIGFKNNLKDYMDIISGALNKEVIKNGE